MTLGNAPVGVRPVAVDSQSAEEIPLNKYCLNGKMNIDYVLDGSQNIDYVLDGSQDITIDLTGDTDSTC